MSSAIKWKAAGCTLAFAIIAAPAAAQSHAQHQPDHNVQHKQDHDRKTNVEVTTAIRLPGVTLSPGTYIFKIRDSKMKQNVVEVWSTDGTKRIGTFLTIDDDTPLVGNNTLVMYDNANPPVLRTWYLPGEPVGRTFVYSEDEARVIHTSANTPVLYAAWDPDDDTVIGSVDVQSVGSAIGQAARKVADVTKDVAKGVADKTEDVWDDITDNARLVNPTPQRKAAERHLDAAEKAYDDLEDRVGDDVESRLKSMRMSLEALEDAFERDEPWMSHYASLMASLDALSPERPVGTSGSAAGGFDASTHASLASIRGHLKAFHAQAAR